MKYSIINKIGLQKMMTPFDKKKILRELGRLGHVDASETLKQGFPKKIDLFTA